MPLISCAPNETLKTKEAKTNLTDSSWGNLEYRARYFEIASASAVMASGANLIVLNYPPNVKLFKELVK
jgi:CO dehydrogenase/acetyl-CoA synthase delta subunit